MNSEYVELVNALSKKITPEYRALILTRLTMINNQLLQDNPVDIMRPFSSIPKRKDSNILHHPATSYNEYQPQRLEVPIPLDIPINVGNRRYSPTKDEGLPEVSLPLKTSGLNLKNNFNYQNQTINIDDIIDDLVVKQEFIRDDETRSLKTSGENDMDSKLQHLNNLHKKLITEKRNRQRTRK